MLVGGVEEFSIARRWKIQDALLNILFHKRTFPISGILPGVKPGCFQERSSNAGHNLGRNCRTENQVRAGWETRMSALFAAPAPNEGQQVHATLGPTSPRLCLDTILYRLRRGEAYANPRGQTAANLHKLIDKERARSRTFLIRIRFF